MSPVSYRSFPPPRPARHPLRRPADALAVLAAAIDHPDDGPTPPQTLALVLDPAHRGLVCAVVEGESDGVAADQLAHLVVGAAQAGAPVGALVLASLRPGHGCPVTPDDHLRFLDARAGCEAVGLELLDWFVLDDSTAWSLAELTDAVPLWQQP